MVRPVLAVVLMSALVGAACDRSPPVASGRATAGLAYTLTPPPGFAKAMDTGKTINWTQGGQKTAPDDPRLVLTRSDKVMAADDRVRRLAPEAMIKGLALQSPSVLQTTAVTIDGFPGFTSVARAHAPDGGEVWVHCTALFAEDGTFYVLAYSGGKDAKANLGLFDAAAQSLTVQ